MKKRISLYKENPFLAALDVSLSFVTILTLLSFAFVTYVYSHKVQLIPFIFDETIYLSKMPVQYSIFTVLTVLIVGSIGWFFNKITNN